MKTRTRAVRILVAAVVLVAAVAAAHLGGGAAVGTLCVLCPVGFAQIAVSSQSVPWHLLPGVLAVLRAATSVLEASNAVLLNFEKPANQSKDVQKKRAEYGQRYYDQFASQTAPAFDSDLEQFRKLFQEMRAELQDNDCGQWSAEARQWALDMGLITGNGTVINGEPNYMWQDLVTREQFVTVLYRLAQIMGSPA